MPPLLDEPAADTLLVVWKSTYARLLCASVSYRRFDSEPRFGCSVAKIVSRDLLVMRSRPCVFETSDRSLAGTSHAYRLNRKTSRRIAQSRLLPQGGIRTERTQKLSVAVCGTRSRRMNTTGTRLSDSCCEKSGHMSPAGSVPAPKPPMLPSEHAFPRGCRHQYRLSRTKIDFSCNTFTGARKV